MRDSGMERHGCDVLGVGGVRRYLGPAAAGLSIDAVDSATSTNALLREEALCGAPEGTVLFAHRQSAGRGRMGRSFFSPGDTGLYMSLLLRPRMQAARAVRLTALAAVAVCAAIEREAGVLPGVKWVNDILVDGRKVCGILTESAFDAATGSLSYAVVGIGVNVYPPEGGFPPELAGVAGSVFGAPRPDGRNRLAAAVLTAFMERYDGLETGAFLHAYRAYSLAPGRNVTVCAQDGERPAKALGIDDDCRLLVAYGDGTQAALSSGEIRIRLDGPDR